MFGIRCTSVCYVPYGDLANHTLLSHRRHPALFARFDEANSRFAFAFAFRTRYDMRARFRPSAFIRSLYVRVRVCTRARADSRCTPRNNRCKHGAHAGVRTPSGGIRRVVRAEAGDPSASAPLFRKFETRARGRQSRRGIV